MLVVVHYALIEVRNIGGVVLVKFADIMLLHLMTLAINILRLLLLMVIHDILGMKNLGYYS